MPDIQPGPEQRSRSVVAVFDGERLLAMRELQGRSQQELATAVGVSPSALSQAERNRTRPSAATVLRLGEVLGVPVEAFAARPTTDNETPLQPQFRHLRRTPRGEQRRALRFVEAISAVTDVLVDALPPDTVFPALPLGLTEHLDPSIPVARAVDDIEAIALRARQRLGCAPDEPLIESGGPVTAAERNGILVVRDPETNRDIDAYSAVVRRRWIVVLDGGSDTVWDRDQFNAAHELGHLVMHQHSDHQPGTRNVEAQAHRFAAAFLAPADAIRDLLPTRLDWSVFLRLKAEWGLSVAALVRRAKDLGRIDDSTYQLAMKHRSTNRWNRVEPGHDLYALPRPRLLANAFDASGLDVADVVERARLPESVVRRVLGGVRRLEV